MVFFFPDPTQGREVGRAHLLKDQCVVGRLRCCRWVKQGNGGQIKIKQNHHPAAVSARDQSITADGKQHPASGTFEVVVRRMESLSTPEKATVSLDMI